MAKQDLTRGVQDHSEIDAGPMTDRDRDRTDPDRDKPSHERSNVDHSKVQAEPPDSPDRAPRLRGAPKRPVNLTRKDMEDVIKAGGSVIHKGEHFFKVEELPSEEELAEGDKDALDQVEASIARQEADLQLRKRALSERRTASTAK